MSSEPDYNFNQPTPSSTSETSTLQLPFALLTAAIAILFIQQTIAQFKMKTTLNDVREQYQKGITAQAPALRDAGEVEKKLTSMIEDLLLLAKTDDKAKAVVTKYGIQQAAPAGGEAPK